MKRISGWSIFLSLSLALIACGRGQPQAQIGPAVPGLEAAVAAKARPSFIADGDVRVWQEERRFYKQNGYRLVWSNGTRPRGGLDELVRAIRAAEQEGLQPEDYGLAELEGTRRSFNPARAVDIDLRSTYAYLKYAWDLTHGSVDPEDIDSQWRPIPRAIDLGSSLEAALNQNRVEESLKKLAPASAQYQGLKHQLARYIAIRDKGGWSAVAELPPFAVGTRHAAAAVLRQRLSTEGDLLPAAGRDDDVVDAMLLKGLGRFAIRHGLSVEKTSARDVLAELNVPAGDRVRQIAVNMDRWRWLPDDLGARYLVVNIPAFTLDAIEDGRSVLNMKVVTGKKTNPTPVLADEMTYLVFSPYWNIPPDIVRSETVPHVLKDPAYLEKNNIEAVRDGSREPEAIDPSSIDWSSLDRARLRFRQRPGTGNSLGLVKFVFPNHFNVYLHDTPAHALFARVERDLSHGCVRLEHPVDLAKYVLRDQPEWTDERMNAAMHAGVERSVTLTRPLPVYLTYFTAWDDNGALQTRADVYGHDLKHRAATEPQ